MQRWRALKWHGMAIAPAYLWQHVAASKQAGVTSKAAENDGGDGIKQ